MLAGPDGAGKSTYVDRVLHPATRLPFVNADLIAADRWPDAAAAHAYEAARIATDTRTRLIAERESFLAETVFSHPSKIDLLRDAQAAGYLVSLHVIVVPVELTVARVQHRVDHGGHTVPEDKIRGRSDRLWTYVQQAIAIADTTTVYDNSSARTPFRVIATYRTGVPVGTPGWPAWTPTDLCDATSP